MVLVLNTIGLVLVLKEFLSRGLEIKVLVLGKKSRLHHWFSGLITMQNLVAVCHAMWAHVGEDSNNFLGRWAPCWDGM